MEKFNSIFMFKWTGKNLKPIIIVQIIAFTLSVIFSSSYFIPKQYKSYTTFYPYNISGYSKEVPSEQMLEFLNSVDIKNDVIAHFNLAKHYDLKPDERGFYEKLISAYDKNVVLKPTEYMAIDLTVYDTDPDTAYQMVNVILDVLNKKILQVQRDKSLEVARQWKIQMDNKKHQVDSLTALSKDISTKYGMLEYGSQSRELSRAYYSAIQNKASPAFQSLQQEMKNVEEKGMEFRSVNQHLEAEINDYNGIELKYEDAMKDVNKQLTFWSMVSAPFKPDTYCYPIRSLIVIGTCVAALIFSILFLRYFEKTKD